MPLFVIVVLGLIFPSVVNIAPQSEPQPERLVLKVVLAGEPATVTIPNGGTVRMYRAGGPFLKLVPILTSDGVQALIESSQFDRSSAAPTGVVDAVVLKRGVAVHRDVAGTAVDIEWTDMREPATTATVVPSAPCRVCCVTCGESTFCACMVEMVCGSCCCPTACDCETRAVPGAGTSGCQAVLAPIRSPSIW